MKWINCLDTPVIIYGLFDGIRRLPSDIINKVNDDAAVTAPAEYTVSRPVVFCGSSITQGGCTSRPGNAYMSILARSADAAGYFFDQARL